MSNVRPSPPLRGCTGFDGRVNSLRSDPGSTSDSKRVNQSKSINANDAFYGETRLAA